MTFFGIVVVGRSLPRLAVQWLVVFLFFLGRNENIKSITRGNPVRLYKSYIYSIIQFSQITKPHHYHAVPSSYTNSTLPTLKSSCTDYSASLFDGGLTEFEIIEWVSTGILEFYIKLIFLFFFSRLNVSPFQVRLPT